MATSKQSVILLDEGWVVTLYVAVGLRNAGCEVHIVTAVESERLDVKFLGSGITREAVPPVRAAGYLRAIEAAISSRPSASVLIFTEAVMYRIWEAAPHWMDRLYPEVTQSQRELLLDKARMSDFLASAGVQIPAQHRIASTAGVDAAIQALGLPVVVKGVTGVGGAAVRIARSAPEAHQAAVEIAKRGSCFMQEYIAGPTFLVGGLFHDGNPLRIYAGEKLECSHATGPSFRLRSEDDPALLTPALAIFRALRWNGLASVDVIRGKMGNYYFLDFNPRAWGAIAASAQCGVDLFRPLATLLTGQIPESDLSFAKGVHSTLFPQVAMARLRSRGIRGITCLVREPRIWLGAPWRSPGLSIHLARHLWWSWRMGTATATRELPAPDAAYIQN